MTYKAKKFLKTYRYTEFRDFVGYNLKPSFTAQAYADFFHFTMSHNEPISEALELWAERSDNKYID